MCLQHCMSVTLMMKHHPPPTCGASDGTQSHEDVYVSIWFECAGVMHAGNTSL